ncbi:hypothetical protein [Micromonospora sp. NPDC047074]|uniref:hypothetical protein n=1 Tax=Micromonospora sp. NPDC047074 TaxID=3154339 RepID=UPI0033DED3F1
MSESGINEPGQPRGVTLTRRRVMVGMAGVAASGLVGPLLRAPSASAASATVQVSLPADVLSKSVPVNLGSALHGSAFNLPRQALDVVSDLRLRLVRDRLVPGVLNQQRALEGLAKLGVKVQGIAAFPGDDEECVRRRVAVAARWPGVVTSVGYDSAVRDTRPESVDWLRQALRSRRELRGHAVREHHAATRRPGAEAISAASSAVDFPTWFESLDQTDSGIAAPRAWLSQVSSAATSGENALDYDWTLFGARSGLVRTGGDVTTGRWHRTSAYEALRNLLRLADEEPGDAPAAPPPRTITIDTPAAVRSLAARTSGGRLVIAFWLPVTPGRPVTGGPEHTVRVTLDGRSRLETHLPSLGSSAVRTSVGDSWDFPVRDHAVVCTAGPGRS